MGAINFILTTLAAVSSVACTVFLFRAYAGTGTRLLLWSGLCFVFLSANNVLLFLDLVVLPDMDLRFYRLSTALAGLLFLLYGFIWEAK